MRISIVVLMGIVLVAGLGFFLFFDVPLIRDNTAVSVQADDAVQSTSPITLSADSRSVDQTELVAPTPSARNLEAGAQTDDLTTAVLDLRDFYVSENLIIGRTYDASGEVIGLGAMGTFGEPPSGEFLRRLSSPTDDRLQTEPIDPSWAPGMQASLYSVVGATTNDVIEIEAVECRTSICRVIVDHGESLQQLDNAARQERFAAAQQLLIESFQPLIADPRGRLHAFASSVQSSADGDVTIYTLSGPRLSSTTTAP